MFAIGKNLINKTNGITGTFQRQFYATGFGTIVVVKVSDGIEYRAPFNEWKIKE